MSRKDRFRLAFFWQQASEFSRALELLHLLFVDSDFEKTEQANFPQIFSRSDETLREVVNRIYYFRRNSGAWSEARSDVFKTFLDPQYASSTPLQNEMIRLVSDLVAYTPAEKEWLARWDPQQLPEPGSAASFQERVAGLWALGHWQRALELLTLHLQRNPSNYDAVICFFEMAALTNQWQHALDVLRLSGDDFSEWVDIFLISLGQAAVQKRSHTRFDVDALQVAMSGDDPISEALRWPVAQILAEYSYRAAAVNMAKSALSSLSGQERSAALLTTATWALEDYDLESVRRLVALPVDALSGDFKDPNMHILRLRWLTMSPEERKRWEWTLRDAFLPEGSPASLSLCAEDVLIAVLKNENTQNPIEQKALLEKINALRDCLIDAGSFGSNLPSLASWASEGVEQLRLWGCDSAMGLLAESAHVLDPALAELRGFSDARDFKFLKNQMDAIRLRDLSMQERRVLAAVLVSELSEERCLAISQILSSWGNYDAALDFSFSDLATNKTRSALRESYKNAYVLSDVETLKILNSILLEQNPPMDDVAPRKTLFFQRALLFFRTRDLAEASSAMEEVLKIDPQDEMALGWSSRFLWWQGDYEQAIALREKQMTIKPTAETADFLITWAGNLGDYERAWRVLKTALEMLPPEQFVSVLRNFLALFKSTQLQTEAFSFVEKISSHLPPPAAFRNLETLLLDGNLSQGQSEQIETEIADLLKNNSSLENANLHYLGKKLLGSKQENKIDEERLIQAWAVGNGPREAAYALFEYYLQNKKVSDANRILDHLLKKSESLTPDEAAALLKICEKENTPKFAVEIWKARLAGEPNNLAAQFGLAKALSQDGQGEAANAILTKFKQLRFILPELSQHLADYENSLGNFSESAGFYQEVTKHGNTIQRRQADLAAAEDFFKIGKRAAARELLESALLIPSDKFPISFLGKFFAEEQVEQATKKREGALKNHFAALDDELLRQIPEWLRQEIFVAFLEQFFDLENAQSPRQLRQWQEAIFKLFENQPALAALPQGAEILNTCALETGQMERASKIWRQVTEHFPY
ncbi:MAG: tetratricopeptide repeat protein, partial [Chthoniobacterales bacterium]